MSNTVDCSRMSHTSCVDEAAEVPETPPAGTSAPAAQGSDSSVSGGEAALRDAEGRPVRGASFECVNDCVSSLGVTALVSGATVSLGCLMVPPACPIFIGASVGSLLGACEVACEDLESQP